MTDIKQYCYDNNYRLSIGEEFDTITTNHSDSVQILIGKEKRKIFVEVFPIKGDIVSIEFSSLEEAFKAFKVREVYMNTVVYENFKMF